MKKIVSAFLIVPAMGFATAQARTVNFVHPNQGGDRTCHDLRVRGTLAVLTDVSGAHSYRISYDKNSVEIFSQDRAVSQRMLDLLGSDVYAEGCMDASGRMIVTKLVPLGTGQDQGGQGQDQGQDKNDQGQGGQDQGHQGQGDQGQDQGQDKNDQGQGGQDQGQHQGQHQGQDQGQDKNDQGQGGQGQGQGGQDQGNQGQGDQGQDNQGQQGQDQGQDHHHHHHDHDGYGY